MPEANENDLKPHPVMAAVSSMNDKPAPTIIVPSIGRRVWYWPSDYDRGLAVVKPPEGTMQADNTQPCDAGICYVHSDRMVNLTVADHNGHVVAKTSVRLLQEGDAPPEGGGYATWMPYQVGQARKG